MAAKTVVDFKLFATQCEYLLLLSAIRNLSDLLRPLSHLSSKLFRIFTHKNLLTKFYLRALF